MKEKKNYYVLTGGPGSGKTTLIEELTEKGFSCISESGRKIIREQMAIAGKALPWMDTREYARLMLEQAITDYEQAEGSDKIHFFDRGIPDILGYERLIQLPENKKLLHYSNTYRYNPVVFILPPWKDIYMNDNERKQDFQTAIDTYEIMKCTYQELGYSLIEVPCTEISARIQFILDTVNRQNL